MNLSNEDFSPKFISSLIFKGSDSFLNLAAAFLDRHRLAKLLFLSVVLAGSIVLFLNWNDIYNLVFGEDKTRLFLVDRLVMDFPYYLLIGVILGTFGFLLPTKVLPELHIIGFVLCLGVISTSRLETPIPYNVLSFSVNIFGTYLLYFLGYYLPRKKSLKVQLIFIYGACLASLFLNSFTLLFSSGFNFFWYLQSIRLIFIFSTLVQERYYGLMEFNSKSEFYSYIFSPSVFLTPLPVPSKEWKFTKDTKIRLIGFANLILNILFVVAAVLLKTQIINQMEPHGLLSYLKYGFLKYIFYYLASCAWIEIPVSLCQWMGGMPLIAGFDFPLLAPNPFDRWRAWNTYYYRWFGWNIFIPTQKKTKSPLLAVTLVFLFTMFIHSGRDNIYLFTLSEKIFNSKILLTQFLFFTAHGLLVYIALKTPRWWGASGKLSGWRGVMLMTLIMSLVHIIAL